MNVTGHRPTSHMEIDCSKLKPATVKAIPGQALGHRDCRGNPAFPDELIKLITDSEGQV